MHPKVIKMIFPLYSLIRHLISKFQIYRMLRKGNDILLEVGAGDKKGINGWITIDVTRKCDIFWDLRRGIPFPDKSVAKIYSSHFLEHLSFREGQAFLDECLRVLINGGSFSICVPNARIYIEAYFMNYKSENDHFFGYKPAYNNTTKIDSVNYMAYMDGHHKYMFDKENLIYILENKGFRKARLREFDKDLDLKDRDFQSIYAQAEK